MGIKIGCGFLLMSDAGGSMTTIGRLVVSGDGREAVTFKLLGRAFGGGFGEGV